MPMFYTPKPRQFHYDPRFYDPEKENWEAKKKKYAMMKAAKSIEETPVEPADNDIAYFTKRVKELDKADRKKAQQFSLSDLFRKREMPEFNYQPRFSGSATQTETNTTVSAEGQAILDRMRKRKISRRFDMEDTDYFKPISAGKIMTYTLLVCLLLFWIIF